MGQLLNVASVTAGAMSPADEVERLGPNDGASADPPGDLGRELLLDNG